MTATKTSSLPDSKDSKLECSAQGFSVAPMLDWTDRHCRYFHRQLTKRAWLYSEMVTTGALIYGNNLPRFLGHDSTDSPVVLQLGGSDPAELAHCARLGEEWGYDEINLNVGCPSDRVQNNLIGACLMAYPEKVQDAVAAMKSVVSIPVTVKSRIGLDDQHDFDALYDFVKGLEKAGVDGLILHARNAWLKGLSPKENRDIPPLRYDWVRRIKDAFPELPVALNGGLKQLDDALLVKTPDTSGPALDGAMMGRTAYETPYFLAEVDQKWYGETTSIPTREAVLESMYPYIDAHLKQGGKLTHISRHMLGLFHGEPGGRKWRQYLSQEAFKPNAGIEVLQTAYQLVANERVRMQERSEGV